MAGKPLRDSMPIVTAFIDELRDVFGKDAIDQQIRRSVVDELPGFWAQENGVEVGIRMQWRGEWVSGKDMCTAPMKKAESGGGK